MCLRLATCGDDFGDLIDVQTCEARAGLGWPERLALAKSPSPDAVAACADRIALGACGAAAAVTDISTALRRCGARGTRGSGDPCDNDVQCQAGYCNRNRSQGSGCGTCETFAERGAECEPDVRPHRTCAEGLYCQHKWRCTGDGCRAEGSSCEPLGALDAYCPSLQMSNPSDTVGCLPDLHCSQDRCIARVGEGERCGFPDGPPFCDASRELGCDPTTMQCVPAPRRDRNVTVCGFRADGEACSWDPNFYWQKPCLWPASCVEGTCRVGTICAR
jgi:hypothetical protein